MVWPSMPIPRISFCTVCRPQPDDNWPYRRWQGINGCFHRVKLCGFTHTGVPLHRREAIGTPQDKGGGFTLAGGQGGRQHPCGITHQWVTVFLPASTSRMIPSPR
jgi:hypothetical protein